MTALCCQPLGMNNEIKERKSFIVINVDNFNIVCS